MLTKFDTSFVTFTSETELEKHTFIGMGWVFDGPSDYGQKRYKPSAGSPYFGKEVYLFEPKKAGPYRFRIIMKDNK